MLESIEEHHVVVWMLSEPAGTDPKDERFDAKKTATRDPLKAPSANALTAAVVHCWPRRHARCGRAGR